MLIATGRGGLLASLLAGFGPGLFIALAIHHAGVERRRERAAGHAVLNREALARLERRWDALPPAWQPGPLDDHPYAADLLRCAKSNGTFDQVFVRYQQRLRKTSE